MPPMRTYLRSQPTFSSVSDLTSVQTEDVHRKPFDLGLSPQTLPTKNNNNKVSIVPPSEEPDSYMDLNEFFQRVDRSDDSSGPTESDPDYPKPTVDLLASLLTLGKMIQNQKQLIQNQAKQNISLPPSSLDSTSAASTSSFNEDMNMLSNLQTESGLICPNDSLENFNSYQESKDSTSSNVSPYSKRRVVPEDIKDMDYWNRRKRNNLAAKKSREERRKKELEVVETTKQLEKENSQLTLILKRLTSRNEWLESRLQEIRLRRRTDRSLESSSLSSSAEEN